MVCTLLVLRDDLGKSGSLVPRDWQKTKLLAESIQVEELPRKTSRVKILVTVP